MQATKRVGIELFCVVMLALCGASCSKSAPDGTNGAGDGSGGGAASTGGVAGAAGTDPFGNVTAGSTAASGTGGTGFVDPNVEITGGCGKLEVRNLDLLFMVDDSGSMKEEQAALRRELPRMIERLTTGDIDGDGDGDLLPIEELHLGVVSSDLGLVGIRGIEGCDGLGDDGVLQHATSTELLECTGPYPAFLTYPSATYAAAPVARDFSCISALGTGGCGFEQPLEATLKALLPSSDDRVEFLADPMGFGRLGHGDQENAGFLRPSSGASTSLHAVVMVTDEDDCSNIDTSHLIPPMYLDAADPEQATLLAQGLNVRCHLNPDHLFPAERYVDALKSLRPDSEGLIVFGAIVGVPPALVTPEALAGVDFADRAAREAFYDALLADPAMQVVIDDNDTLEVHDDSIKPSCQAPGGVAYPPLRVVETARGFGRDSVVQSICQDDFGPAIDAILAAITRASNAACIVQ
jgi:hypothetical protein